MYANLPCVLDVSTLSYMPRQSTALRRRLVKSADGILHKSQKFVPYVVLTQSETPVRLLHSIRSAPLDLWRIPITIQEHTNMVKQDALLDAINEHVMRVLHLALDRGLLDAALERKVRGCGKLPMKALQAFVLTSNAFLCVSDEDAAGA